MNVVKHIICELTGYRPGTVDVSQGDRGSRAVSCRLLENGAPWMIPEGAAVRVAYTLPDGTEGLYDALPDGSPAGEIAGNTVTVELADQIMDQAGMAQVSILVLGPEGGQLATWPIRLMVIANKAARLTVPEHMPPYGAGFSGKIFFGGADGTITPLALGEGVAVERLPDGSWQLVGAGSGIAKETDPTVPKWAKQPQKPSYTAQEVGALPAGTKIPAKTSDLSNDSGFVTKAVNDLANYYTKAQTQELLAAIPRFRVTVVQQLPAAGEELVLYLVPFATAEGQFLEYIWVGGRWEVIGSQRVDLTGYATEAWVLGKLSALDVGSIQIGGGDGIRLESEGTASAPVLVLYGAHGDEPVRIAQVAPAQADGEAVPLGQAKQLVEDVVPSWAMADSKPGYTKSEVGLGNVANERQYSAANPPPYPVTSVNGKAGAVLLGAQDVMAEPVGAAASAVRAHNTNDAAHNDIRLLIDGLATRLNALANSTDTDLDQMAEIVAYIKSNKSLLDGITTSKVSVSDIINNLTTNVANRPLSAAQGVAIKALIDGLASGKLDASKLTEAINTALAQAKASGEFDGEDGITPHIGGNGNWYIGATDTGVSAQGKAGYTPIKYTDYYTDADKKELKDELAAKLIVQHTGDSADNVMSQAAVTAALETITALPHGGSREWLESNGDKSKLYQIGGYAWGYVESNGWTKSDTQFRVVASAGEMTDDGGTPYLLRDGDVGTVYAYAEASGDSGVPVLDSKPTTANEGDIIAVGGRKYKASVNTQQVPNFANIAKLGDDDTDWWPDSRVGGSDGTRRNDCPGNIVTNPLNLVNGDVVRIENLNISSTALDNKCGVYFNNVVQSVTTPDKQTVHFDGISIGESSSQMTANFTGNVRFGGTPTGAISDVIITKNEEITYRTETTVTWTDIGAYIPPVEAGWSATAETYAVIDSLSAAADGGTSAVYSADGYLYGYVGGTGWMQLSRYIAPTLSVDGELDDASRNAIQNRAVAQRFAEVDANVQTNASGITAINERLAEMTSGSGSASVPSFWQNAVDACIAKIKALQVGRRCVTFPFFSDNHTRSGNIQYCGILIAHVMEACGIPYSFFGGDAITSAVASMADSDAEFREQSRAFDVAMSYIPRAKDCRALGNHEGALKGNPDIEGSATVTYTRAQTYEIFQRNKGADQNKHFGGDGTYYYVDDIASKVRWIILNGNSITGVNFCVDAEQLAWLTGTALKFDGDDWGVVLISHCPINNAYHANFINATEVIAAVNGAGVDVIGWFSGHIHRDRIYTTMRVNATDNDEGEAGDPLGFTQVTITSDHTAIAYEDATRHGIGFDDKSHAIDFVTINRDTRTVNITRLGIGEDRSYNY